VAAGVITVVVGSIGTATADSPEKGSKVRVVETTDSPEGTHFRVANQSFGSGGGGRLSFR
jgi:hypothetical protein